MNIWLEHIVIYTFIYILTYTNCPSHILSYVYEKYIARKRILFFDWQVEYLIY